MILDRVIALVIGYCFGLILMGYFIGKIKHVDLKSKGSGNVGSTNTLRVMGVSAGLFTLVCDCIKCVLAVVVVSLIFKNKYDNIMIFQAYAGLGAVLGHDFPCYMKFKGGKGIAATLGFIIAIFPMALPIPLLIFLGIVALTRYVSLGSIIGVSSFAIEMIVFAKLNFFNCSNREVVELVLICCLVSIIAILLHHANIKRLLNGNEHRLSFHPETRK